MAYEPKLNVWVSTCPWSWFLSGWWGFRFYRQCRGWGCWGWGRPWTYSWIPRSHVTYWVVDNVVFHLPSFLDGFIFGQEGLYPLVDLIVQFLFCELAVDFFHVDVHLIAYFTFEAGADFFFKLFPPISFALVILLYDGNHHCQFLFIGAGLVND